MVDEVFSAEQSPLRRGMRKKPVEVARCCFFAAILDEEVIARRKSLLKNSETNEV